MEYAIRYTPTLRDHFKASCRFTMRHRHRNFRWVAIVVLVFGVSYAAFIFVPSGEWSNQSPAALVGLFWIPAMYFLLFPLLVYLSVRSQWPRVPAFREPREYVFSERGISIKAETFNSALTWDHVKKVDAATDMVVFALKSGAFLFLPKRAFPEGAEWPTLSPLVEHWISTGPTTA